MPVDLRVATYNVNTGTVGDPAGIAAIAATEADVVLLQEVGPGWPDALRAELSARWPFQAYLDDGNVGSLGVLSRYPLDEGPRIESPVGWFPAWRVTVHLPGGDAQIVDVHLHPPFAMHGGFLIGAFTTGDDRLVEAIAAADAMDPSVPALIVGDFNERRGRAMRALEDRGYTDAHREFCPRDPTWSWTLPYAHLTGRYDHILYDGRFDGVSAEVIDRGRSDHLPVVAVVRIR